ncbi:hypothetical protein [Mucilaginibacter flavus]|uniref:hypothetical protein n=1 Tax=Mucilaginibacter flavus TaxID=931504 RepID=UPI0025B307CD|nr:hypothetical protein [Mucilaginibacter flavus]MDN3584942.1 hypothetical protein [Mucilaginibacter flavus]
MREVEPPFEIQHNGVTLKVTEAEIKSRRIFYIQFSDNRKVLTVTVGKGLGDEKFWTSIPEGRQEEAEEVGKLIAAFIRGKKN